MTDFRTFESYRLETTSSIVPSRLQSSVISYGTWPTTAVVITRAFCKPFVLWRNIFLQRQNNTVRVLAVRPWPSWKDCGFRLGRFKNVRGALWPVYSWTSSTAYRPKTNSSSKHTSMSVQAVETVAAIDRVLPVCFHLAERPRGANQTAFRRLPEVSVCIEKTSIYVWKTSRSDCAVQVIGPHNVYTRLRDPSRSFSRRR